MTNKDFTNRAVTVFGLLVVFVLLFYVFDLAFDMLRSYLFEPIFDIDNVNDLLNTYVDMFKNGIN